MNFLNEPIYWFLTAGCLGVASIPALVRTISRMRVIAIVMLWLAICTVTLTRFGLLPALATALISGVWGVLLLIASLIFSGIRSMPNQRFEER